MAASAAMTASGVPTCIQTPSRRSPQNPAGFDRPVEQRRHRGRPRGHAGNERRRQDRGPGVNERHHFALAAPRELAVRRHLEIAAAGIADARRGGREQKQTVHPLRIERGCKPRQIGIHPVDPDGVGIDQVERLVAQERQRIDDAAGRPEQFAALVGEHDLRPLPALQMTLDLVGQVMDIHHCALDAHGREPVEYVVDQRFVADLDQRLRHRAVERPHPRAEAGREHHGVFWRDHGSPHVGRAICYASVPVPTLVSVCRAFIYKRRNRRTLATL